MHMRGFQAQPSCPRCLAGLLGPSQRPPHAGQWQPGHRPAAPFLAVSRWPAQLCRASASRWHCPLNVCLLTPLFPFSYPSVTPAIPTHSAWVRAPTLQCRLTELGKGAQFSAREGQADITIAWARKHSPCVFVFPSFPFHYLFG